MFTQVLTYFKNKVPLIVGGLFLVGFVSGFFFSANFRSAQFVVPSNVVTPTAIETISSQQGAAVVYVDLEGAVKKPGSYAVIAGSRVGEVLSKGEGVLETASVEWVAKNLNLAQKVMDSQKIYIPFDWELYVPEDSYKKLAGITATVKPLAPSVVTTPEVPETSASTNNPTGADALINANLASVDALDTLPGIGSVYASRIVAKRPYANFDDFKTRSTLPASVLTGIQNLVTF